MSLSSPPALSPTLARIARGNLCAGCGLCESLAAPGRIAMHVNDAGFLRPRVSAALSPEEDAAIARLCPGLALSKDPTESERHPLWGAMISTRVGHATDETLRHHASSGGALSAILGFLLETGAVDGIIQTAADPDRPIANRTVESVSLDDIYRAAGSRYAPSAPLARLRDQLDRPGRFAFVGKPCDVAALRAYGREDRRVGDRFPYVLSFFCAGVPSLAGARAILERFGVAETEVAAFRYRGDGWPGCAAAITVDGRTRQMGYDESWGGILTRYVQFRCKICPDGTGGLADLVCADAWYGDARGFPTFADAPGRSLIVSRTTTGEDLLRRAEAAGFLVTEPIDAAAIAAMQPGQRQRKALVLSRLAALALLGRQRPRYRGFDLARAARQVSMLTHVRSFLGTVRRSRRGAFG
ncbi:MAG: Coenzyme F420 hydrogenase/dehydrogenase, beta subunit C-terminal domain [Rhodospirillales bacterium]|nr:Coenzyme F420 hydrogenase/dehydrogenase, beta subunit C-terminal domain [Rhodospirillales bacterium]